MKRALLLLCFLMSANVALANEAKDSQLFRMQYPLTLSVAMGNPAPSWIGGGVAVQLNPMLQAMISTGSFWSGELDIWTFSGSLRIQMLQTNLTPILGAGFSIFKLSGTGSIQTLESSTALGSLLVGGEWMFEEFFRVSAGFNFHFPLKLNFPFIELGYAF